MKALDMASRPLHGDGDRNTILNAIAGRKNLLFQMVLTPGLAKCLMEKNTANMRKISKGRVGDYARDMKEGGWVNGVALLRFGRDQRMINGQHTCTAAIQADHSPVVLMEVNCAPDKEKVCDSMAPRKAYQNLGLTSDIQAVAGRFTELALKEKGAMSSHRLNAILSEYGKSIKFASNNAYTRRRGVIGDGVFAAAIAWGHNKGIEEAVLSQFIVSVRNGDGDLKGLHDVLMETRPGSAGVNAQRFFMVKNCLSSL